MFRQLVEQRKNSATIKNSFVTGSVGSARLETLRSTLDKLPMNYITPYNCTGFIVGQISINVGKDISSIIHVVTVVPCFHSLIVVETSIQNVYFEDTLLVKVTLDAEQFKESFIKLPIPCTFLQTNNKVIILKKPHLQAET